MSTIDTRAFFDGINAPCRCATHFLVRECMTCLTRFLAEFAEDYADTLGADLVRATKERDTARTKIAELESWAARDKQQIERLLAAVKRRGEQRDEVRESRDRMEAAILWALGERGEFTGRRDGDPPYWWRSELRRRAALTPPAAVPVSTGPLTEECFHCRGSGLVVARSGGRVNCSTCGGSGKKGGSDAR